MSDGVYKYLEEAIKTLDSLQTKHLANNIEKVRAQTDFAQIEKPSLLQQSALLVLFAVTLGLALCTIIYFFFLGNLPKGSSTVLLLPELALLFGLAFLIAKSARKNISVYERALASHPPSRADKKLLEAEEALRPWAADGYINLRPAAPGPRMQEIRD